MEALFAIIPVWLWHSPAQGIPFWVSLILFVYFGVVIVIDLEHRLILHSVSLVGAVIGIFCGVVIHGWKATLLGGLSGLGIMLALYLFGWLFLKVIIRRKEGDERASLEDEEALGFGDVTLNTVLGFIVGWPLNVFAIGIAILAGGLVSLLYLVFKLLTGEYRSFMAVPYGPFLVSGAVIVLYFWKPLLAIL
ncbi:MAG: hypothetical protein GX495_10515 [Chloroflexi bacterium]|nr:hypothetical protein [Chloroflexota bacterium]